MANEKKIVITDVGLAEVINAEHSGTQSVVLAKIGFGTGQYTATSTMTEMKAKFKELTTLGGGAVGDNIIHVTVNDDSADTYSVYEVGVYTDKGTLLAIYSQNTPIVQKAAASEIMLALDIVLTGANPETITVGETNFVLNPATHDKSGVVKLATNEDTIEGTSTELVVTPAGLSARKATTTNAGLVELATDLEVQEGKSAEAVITPKSLAAAFVFGDTPSGYQKFPSGIIMQWGKALIANGTAGTRITFPVAFKSALRSLVCTASGSVTLSYTIAASNTTGATVKHNGNGGAETFWVAFGK